MWYYPWFGASTGGPGTYPPQRGRPLYKIFRATMSSQEHETTQAVTLMVRVSDWVVKKCGKKVTHVLKTKILG